MNTLYIAISIIGAITAYSLLLRFRHYVVSKARQEAREAVFSAGGKDYFKLSEMYYAAGSYDEMLHMLTKWRFTDFYGQTFKELK